MTPLIHVHSFTIGGLPSSVHSQIEAEGILKMLGFSPQKEGSDSLRILCVGAHSDDIEIGCGGTILKLIAINPNLHLHWIVFGADNEKRAAEAFASAKTFLAHTKEPEIVVKGFRDGFFPYLATEIKEYFEQLKDIAPDLIFTHYKSDLHQDHRLLCELTWNTFRDHTILEYEIPKYDGDLGTPNIYIQLDKATCQRKIEFLFEHFQTQQDKDWFSQDTFWSLLRLRGMEARAPGKYAEAFYGRKLVIA